MIWINIYLNSVLKLIIVLDIDVCNNYNKINPKHAPKNYLFMNWNLWYSIIRPERWYIAIRILAKVVMHQLIKYNINKEINIYIFLLPIDWKLCYAIRFQRFVHSSFMNLKNHLLMNLNLWIFNYQTRKMVYCNQDSRKDCYASVN